MVKPGMTVIHRETGDTHKVLASFKSGILPVPCLVMLITTNMDGMNTYTVCGMREQTDKWYNPQTFHTYMDATVCFAENMKTLVESDLVYKPDMV